MEGLQPVPKVRLGVQLGLEKVHLLLHLLLLKSGVLPQACVHCLEVGMVKVARDDYQILIPRPEDVSLAVGACLLLALLDN